VRHSYFLKFGGATVSRNVNAQAMNVHGGVLCVLYYRYRRTVLRRWYAKAYHYVEVDT